MALTDINQKHWETVDIFLSRNGKQINSGSTKINRKSEMMTFVDKFLLPDEKRKTLKIIKDSTSVATSNVKNICGPSDRGKAIKLENVKNDQFLFNF